ncbi:MAG: hypothetical protein ABRQ37_26460 [Candidatus Eremiobacterota bacterium]
MDNNRKFSLIFIMKATCHSTLQMVKYYDTSDELADNATVEMAEALLE